MNVANNLANPADPSLPQRWQDVAAFVFFAAVLGVPSGYSWGSGLTVLLALGMLLRSGRGFFAGLERQDWAMGGLFIGLGVLWSHSFDGLWTWLPNKDYFYKYSLAALALWGAKKVAPNVAALRWGLAAGALAACVVALRQYFELGRATGFTNAIQFGDVAIILALGNWLFASIGARPWWERAVLVLAGCLALLASLLSLSRGGWLMLVLVPVLMSFLGARRAQRMQLLLGVSLAAGLALAALAQFSAVQQRIALASSEVQTYLADPGSDKTAQTSVGQRLEQWRLAWYLGQQRPWTGWGKQGLIAAKEDAVQSGRAHPSVLEFEHAHNELLDMWARRGAVGVVMLLAAYVLPLVVFYPTQRRRDLLPEHQRGAGLALHILGMSVALGCVVFGLTQVFFAHNSGHMFYAFALVFIYGALAGLKNCPASYTPMR